MDKSKVRIGVAFEIKSGGSFNTSYKFSVCRSNKIQIIRKGGAHQCYVSNTLDNGIEVSMWTMNKEFKSFISYDEMIYIEQKNNQ